MSTIFREESREQLERSQAPQAATRNMCEIRCGYLLFPDRPRRVGQCEYRVSSDSNEDRLAVHRDHRTDALALVLPLAAVFLVRALALELPSQHQ